MGKKRKKALSITERLKAGETAEEIFGADKVRKELAEEGIFEIRRVSDARPLR